MTTNITLVDFCLASLRRTELDLIRDTNITMPALSNRTREFWKSPRGTVTRIEVLVGLVVFLQLFLIVCGSWRRRSRNWFIQGGVLAAYTLSNSLVSYTLGSMQSSAIKSTMYSLWAISLYILFGCADSITAYSLTDNSQLTRQIYQTALGYAYVVLIMASTFGNQSNTDSLHALLRALPVIYLAAGATINLVHRLAACQMASASWKLNKVVADYMYKEQSGSSYDPASMTGYHYLVDCTLSPGFVVVHSSSYVIESLIKKKDCPDPPIIDIEMVWNDDGRPSLSPDVKDACLSFSLFHLLRRRFFGFECGESSQPKTHDFVFRGLLAKKKEDGGGQAEAEAEAAVVDYNRVFKVIEVELDFMYDFFFTRYAAIYYGGGFAFSCVLPLGLASLTALIAFLTAAGPLRPPSAKSRTLTDASSVLLDTTEADVGITTAILLCISFLQLAQLPYYWTSIWGRVSFACQRVRGSGGRGMGLKELLVQIGVFMSGCCWYQREEKLGQYSLPESVSNSSKQCRVTRVIALLEERFPHALSAIGGGVIRLAIAPDVWRAIRKPGKHAKLPLAVKKAIVQSLERTQGKLSNGESSLLSNGAHNLLGNCKLRPGGEGTGWSQKEENQVCVILTWHIATCYCSKELLAGTGVTQELKEHHEVATTLSKYSAYLVGFQPKLLPGHHYDKWHVFSLVAEEAILQSKGEHQREETIYRKGLKLGEELKNMEAARCWKVLADFWAEMLLYLAPSDNVKEHVECLAKGGEFITHLWALLTHAGILDRRKTNNVTNDIENPGDGPSYTHSCAAPSTLDTNQPPTSSNPTMQWNERDVVEKRDSGADQSDARELSNGAAFGIRPGTSYLDKCEEGATSATARAMNNSGLLGNCPQSNSRELGMMVHQPANPVENEEKGAPNDANNGPNEIEDTAY